MWGRIAFLAQFSCYFSVSCAKKILACASPDEFNLYLNFFVARKWALPSRDKIQVRPIGLD